VYDVYHISDTTEEQLRSTPAPAASEVTKGNATAEAQRSSQKFSNAEAQPSSPRPSTANVQQTPFVSYIEVRNLASGLLPTSPSPAEAHVSTASGDAATISAFALACLPPPNAPHPQSQLVNDIANELATTCPVDLGNNAKLCDLSRRCGYLHCTGLHLCKTFWNQAKLWLDSACPYGGEGVKHFDTTSGQLVWHGRPNCKKQFPGRGHRGVCFVIPDMPPCSYGHDHAETRRSVTQDRTAEKWAKGRG